MVSASPILCTVQLEDSCRIRNVFVLIEADTMNLALFRTDKVELEHRIDRDIERLIRLPLGVIGQCQGSAASYNRYIRVFVLVRIGAGSKNAKVQAIRARHGRVINSPIEIRAIAAAITVIDRYCHANCAKCCGRTADRAICRNRKACR